MQVLIIEDEPRAANQLQILLKNSKFDHTLLDIIDSVEDAVLWFQNNTSPDLVFMDIQLADGLSFEIFQKVEVDAPIIFTTAFDQYAIQAFKVNSVDYLLKPIQQKDLNLAIDQFLKSNQPATLESHIYEQLLNTLQAKRSRHGVLVKDGAGFVQIKISDILYLYSEDGITFGMTSGKRYIIDETLDQFLNSIDSDRFFRINRGQAISKSSIERIVPYFNHRVKLSITNSRDLEFVVSRQKTSDFKQWLNR